MKKKFTAIIYDGDEELMRTKDLHFAFLCAVDGVEIDIVEDPEPPPP